MLGKIDRDSKRVVDILGKIPRAVVKHPSVWIAVIHVGCKAVSTCLVFTQEGSGNRIFISKPLPL